MIMGSPLRYDNKIVEDRQGRVFNLVKIKGEGEGGGDRRKFADMPLGLNLISYISCEGGVGGGGYIMV